MDFMCLYWYYIRFLNFIYPLVDHILQNTQKMHNYLMKQSPTRVLHWRGRRSYFTSTYCVACLWRVSSLNHVCRRWITHTTNFSTITHPNIFHPCRFDLTSTFLCSAVAQMTNTMSWCGGHAYTHQMICKTGVYDYL